MRIETRGRRGGLIVEDSPRPSSDLDQHALDARGRIQRLRRLALAETSAAFTSSGPAYEAAFPVIASRLALRVQGGCLIRPLPDLVERIPLVAVHARPQEQQALATLMHTSPEALGSAYCAWVAQRGRSLLTPEVSLKSMRLWTDQPAWPYLQAHTIFTFLVTPILTADSVVGTLTLWRERPGEPLSADDQVFVEEVGCRLIVQ